MGFGTASNELPDSSEQGCQGENTELALLDDDMNAANTILQMGNSDGRRGRGAEPEPKPKRRTYEILLFGAANEWGARPAELGSEIQEKRRGR